MANKTMVRASGELTGRLFQRFGRKGLGRLVEPVAGTVSDQTLGNWKLAGVPLAYIYYIKGVYPEVYREVLGDPTDEASDRQ